jgi:2-polyprenyl-3-methyl-5-hydroxy-6-metoxy-1,4-benzoquinol methylase
MIKQYYPIKIETDHPHPVDSPDYLDPAGCVEDNHSNAYFIHEIDKAFRGLPYKLLDLGCAGGQFAIDICNKGYPWAGIGIEGGNIWGMTGSFEAQEKGTGDLSAPRGADNWREYKEKCLFNADISKPFELLLTEYRPGLREEEVGGRVLFEIITAYEFLEHPLPTEIPQILENVKKHLHPDGIFVGTINLSPSDHHRCAKPFTWWLNVFAENGFEYHHYPFASSPRSGLEYLSWVCQHTADLPPDTDFFVLDESVFPPAALNHRNFKYTNEYNFPFMVTHKSLALPHMHPWVQGVQEDE